MTGAAIASAAVGVGGLVQGGKESKKADQAYDNAVGEASQLNDFLNKLGADGVEQAQGFMDDWESTFGGIQDNLSDYYSNLDPNKFATQNKSTLSDSMNKQMTQFNDTMSASGLQSAGMKQQASQEAAFKQAEGNAAIDIAAPEQVNQMQQGFLQMGEGQRSQATNMMGSSLTNQANLASQGGQLMINARTGQGDRAQQSSNGWMGAGGTAMGGAMSLGINSKDNWFGNGGA